MAFFGCTIVFGLPVVGELMRPMWQLLWNYQPTLLGLRFLVSFLILLLPTTAMGFDAAGNHRGPWVARDGLWPSDWFSLRLKHTRGNAWRCPQRSLLDRRIWTLRHEFGRRRSGLHCCRDCIGGSEIWSGSTRQRFQARLRLGAFQISVAFRCELSAAVAFAFHQLRHGSDSSCAGSDLVPISASIRRIIAYRIRSNAGRCAGWYRPGGVLAGTISRRSTRSNQLISVLLLLAAVAVLLSYLLFPGEAVKTAAGAFSLGSWPQIALLCLALMFPVSFLSGVMFPTIVARVQVEVANRMNCTGIATLLNTSGAAIGPLLATFFLLPSLGYQTSLICCAAAYALLSILVTERALFSSLRRPAGIILATLWIALLIGLVIFPYRRSETHFEHASRPYERDDQGLYAGACG